jgi:hypothetical protein
MPDILQWYVGNRNPSITETLTVGGVAYDLTSSTVKFKAREVGSAALLIDAAATIVTPSSGTVRYDFSAGDASTGLLSAARSALVWWEVTTSGKTQDMGEALIQILAHSEAQNYVSLEAFKHTLTLASETFADADITVALSAASRAIDKAAGRRFWVDANANSVRYYTPDDPWRLSVDDLVTITSLKTDDAGDGTFENTWTVNTDYVAEPLNAVTDSEPWTHLSVHPMGRYLFPGFPRSVELTGKFGWPAVPAEIRQATTIAAHRLLRRAREVPFGVAGIGLDGSAVRIVSQDPDVAALVAPYSRTVLVA